MERSFRLQFGKFKNDEVCYGTTIQTPVEGAAPLLGRVDCRTYYRLYCRLWVPCWEPKGTNPPERLACT